MPKTMPIAALIAALLVHHASVAESSFVEVAGGYGNSAQATQAYSAVDDIGEVMTGLAIKRATVVGSSANGGRAMAFALDHPEAVDALIVSGPSVPGVPFSEDFLKLLSPFGESVVKGDLPGAIAAVEQCPYCVAAGNDKAKQELMALLRARPHNLQMRPLQKSGVSIVARLSELKMRTLVIVGDSDHDNNLNHARIAHQMIPQSAFVTMKNAGHLPYLEHPREFAELVIAFMGRR